MTRYLLGLLVIAASASGATKLKLQGSTTVNPVAVDAAEYFKKKGWTVFVDTQGGSSGGIAAVAEGHVDIGMTSKPLTEDDRRKYPKADLRENVIGYDGVAIIVSPPVFNGGVKAVTKEQLKSLYEGGIRNWKELGGPDKPVAFFNKEPGRGTWEVFAAYVYGKPDKAPAVDHPEVGANEETRTKVANHPSALSQLSASWAEPGSGVNALSIIENGKPVAPTLDNIRAGTYPLRRALNFVTNGPPKGAAKEFLAYVLSPPGQELMRKHGYLPVKRLP